MKKRLRIYPMVALMPAVVMMAASCSDDENTNPITSAPESTANVLIVHASPNAPGVDIIVDDGGVAVSNLQFPSNTGYVALDAGTRNVKVNVTGTSTTVIEADLDLSADASYSVFAVNNVSKLQPLVVTDDLTSPGAGKAHVRFIHLSPDAPAVDVAVAGGPVIFGNVSYQGVNGFTPLDAGTYDLEVRLAGTATVVLPLPGITLSESTIYTVFAKGLVSGNGSKALGAEIIVNK